MAVIASGDSSKILAMLDHFKITGDGRTLYNRQI
jgi:hypothetical protein